MPIDADGRFAAPEGLRRGRAGCLGTFSWGRAAPGCGDGDLPLNTGAMPDRRIGPPQAERPREAGRRIDGCGEAVHGTRGGAFRPAPWRPSRRRGSAARPPVPHWHGETVTWPPTGRRLVGGRLRNGGEAIVARGPDGRRIVAPAPAFRDPLDIIAAPEFDGEVPEQEEESPT